MKKFLTALLLSISLFSLPLFALEERIVMGVEDNWKDLSFTGVVSEIGKKGNLDLKLTEGEYSPDGDTDLLLHFNSPVTMVDAGMYAVKKSSILISGKHTFYGSGSGVFQGEREGVVLTPARGSLFAPGTAWEDFTIEFWMYSAYLGDGETILLWQGTAMSGETITPQELRCSIENRKIVWDFSNFFQIPGPETLDIQLTGRTSLIPRTWHHHLIRFDSQTGLLEYTLDGIPDGIIYTNKTGREGRVIGVPAVGSISSSDLIVGRSFTGLLDELRVSRVFVDEAFTKKYTQKTGVAKTRIFDLNYTNSELLKINALFDTPGGTAVSFFYRVGNDITRFQKGSENELAWHQFNPGSRFSGNNRGRYAQIMIELFPDGYGTISPSVSEVELLYEPDYPPPPPAFVTAKPGNESIALTWKEVESPDVRGYLIYYGDRPGYYFGSDARAGRSPLDAGNSTSVTLEGLSNGKLYYFSIAAYDSADPPHISAYSKEISSRPSSLLGRPE